MTVNAYKFKSSLHLEESVPADAFRLCWLSQGPNRFLVLKNTAGKKPTLWVLAQDVVTYIPEKDRGFGVAVTKENLFFIDYLDAQNWTDRSISHYEPKHQALKTYVVYIESPAFPEPPIGANDKDKVRYGQIAVNSQIGTLQGSVSSAATIMSIYRTRPACAAGLPAGRVCCGSQSDACQRPWQILVCAALEQNPYQLEASRLPDTRCHALPCGQSESPEPRCFYL